MTDFTILIPVHNEADKLLDNLNTLISYLERLPNNYSILLVENGSKDETRKLLDKLVGTNSNVSYTVLTKANLGLALYKGVTAAKSEYVIYLPIDLSVDLEFVPASIQHLETHDIVIGSKRMKGSSNRRPIIRKLLSTCYHSLIQLLFKTRLSDTTCVKAFRRSKILPILKSIRFIDIFDTELLIKAEKTRCAMIEVPVRVSDNRLPKEQLFLKIMRKVKGIVALRVAS